MINTKDKIFRIVFTKQRLALIENPKTNFKMQYLHNNKNVQTN